MNREQSIKFFTSGSLMFIVFYLLLGVFSFGLRDTSLPGLSAIQILFIPIIIAVGGIGYASYNFGFDPKEPWDKGKLIAILIAVSAALLIIAQVSLIAAGADEDGFPIRLSLFYIGDIMMIISCISFGVSFFFLRKQLFSLYLKKIIIKNPNVMVIGSFALQAVAYCLFFGAFFTAGDVQTSIDLAGIVIAALAVLLLIGGFIPLNISFRAYAHLLEDESLRE